MTAHTCGLCGKVATGIASIGDTRYCHGDNDITPTCYERAQWVRDQNAAIDGLVLAIFGGRKCDCGNELDADQDTTLCIHCAADNGTDPDAIADYLRDLRDDEFIETWRD